MSDGEDEDAPPLPQKKSSSNQESTLKSLLPITHVLMYLFFVRYNHREAKEQGIC